jgi:hypothetical protein
MNYYSQFWEMADFGRFFLDWYLRFSNEMHQYLFGPDILKAVEIVEAQTLVQKNP